MGRQTQWSWAGLACGLLAWFAWVWVVASGQGEARVALDSSTYLAGAQLSWFDSRLWFGETKPVVSLLWSLVGAEPAWIVRLHWTVHALAFGALAAAAASVMRSPVAAAVAFGLVAGMGMTTKVLLWHGCLLTESLANSATALAAAAGLRLVARPSVRGWAAFTACCLAVLGTRDAWAYVLLPASILGALACLRVRA